MLNEDTRRRLIKITAICLAVMVGLTGFMSSGIMSVLTGNS